jgi:hypothetical protein
VRNAVRILLVISAITCYPGPQSVSQTPHLAPRQAYCELTPRDYAVYAALMLDLRDPEYPAGAGAKRILILGTTAKPTKSDLTARWTARNSDSSAAPASDTVADFKVNADSRCSIKPEFDDPQSYDIVGSEDVDALFTKHAPLRYLGWEEFYKKYPNYAGYWTFSRPGVPFTASRAETTIVFSLLKRSTEKSEDGIHRFGTSTPRRGTAEQNDFSVA